MKNSDIVSFIYIVNAGEFIKIGFTHDVEKRLSEIQVHNPLEVKLYFTLKIKQGIVRHVEDFIHYKLKTYHVRGEWFSCSPELAKETILKYFPENSGETNHGSGTSYYKLDFVSTVDLDRLSEIRDRTDEQAISVKSRGTGE